MEFYIVTGAVGLVEPDGGLIGKWFPSFFYIMHPYPPMKPREMNATIMEEHLKSSHCWERRRFDSLEDAEAYAKEEQCRNDEAVAIYHCSIPAEPAGRAILGKPSVLPPNAVFLSLEEIAVQGVQLHNYQTGYHLDIDFASNPTHAYHKRY